MKRIVLMGAAAAIMLAGIGCVVEGGVEVGNGGSGSCVEISCGEALASGLPAQGDAICDGASDSAYSAIFECACGAGSACADVCGDNLCLDAGETGECGDCLNANCPGEHTDCANN